MFISKAAKNPNAAKLWLDYILSKRGQTIIANQAELGSIRADVEGEMTRRRLHQDARREPCKPIPVSADLLGYLDQTKRLEFLKQWQAAIKGRQVDARSPAARSASSALTALAVFLPLGLIFYQSLLNAPFFAPHKLGLGAFEFIFADADFWDALTQLARHRRRHGAHRRAAGRHPRVPDGAHRPAGRGTGSSRCC